ncbi:MAG: DUF3732 domain-containing protein [Gammaproteobacteria bacterium]
MGHPYHDRGGPTYLIDSALEAIVLAFNCHGPGGFLVMDQPFQVYFPKKLVVRENETPEEPQLKDEDNEAVRKAFEVLAKVVESANGRLQVIVLDHASREVWGNIPNIFLMPGRDNAAETVIVQIEPEVERDHANDEDLTINETDAAAELASSAGLTGTSHASGDRQSESRGN